MTAAPGECTAYGHHKLSAVWASLSEDIVRYLNKSPENQAAGDNFKTRVSALLTPQLLCLVLYRVSHYLHVTGWRRSGVAVARFNFLVHKVSITPQSCIGPGCFLAHPAGVVFSGIAGKGLTLYSLGICCPRVTSAGNFAGPGPRLGDRVAVGGHAVVMGPITVGDDVKVAFTVSLDRDAPAGVLVVSKVLRITTVSRNSAGSETPASSDEICETVKPAV